MQSQRKLRKLSQQTRTAREFSCSVIPSKEEAKNRESALHHMHHRQYQLRRKSLEGVVRENYRLFVSIHEQKSSYENLFLDVRKRRKSVRVERLAGRGRQEEGKEVVLQLKKASKWMEMLNCNTKENRRRYHLHPVLRERCANFSQNSNYSNHPHSKPQ